MMHERYYKFSRFLKEKYGEKVWKVTVDAGFTCPNKDPLTGTGGCIFCRNDSFSHMQSLQNISPNEQIEKGISSARERQGIKKYLVYFQSSTNTFAPENVLRQYFNEAVNFPGVVGLVIATRPDCLPPEGLTIIAELSRKTDMWVELGLQSSHNSTLKHINRGHTFEDYLEAVDKLKKLPVRICTHIMIGLPGEERTHIIATAKHIAATGTHEVKIHPLLVLRGTALEKLYANKELREMTLPEYISLACDFLEYIPPEMVIQRLTAESPEDMLIAPQWAANKHIILREIENELINRNTWQGARYKEH